MEREGRQEVPPLGKQLLVTDGCWGREGQFAVSRAIPHTPHKSTQAAKTVFDRFFFVFKMMQSWVGRGRGKYERSKYDQNKLSKILINY